MALDIPGLGVLDTEVIDGAHAQGTYQKAKHTYYAYNEGAFASAKHHQTLFNDPNSGKIVRCRKLFAANLMLTTFAGAVVRLNIGRITQSPTSAGTPAAIAKAKLSNDDLPAGITVRAAATVQNPTVLFPWVTSSAAETAAPALSKSAFQQSVNILAEGAELQEAECPPGYGLTVHQVGTHAGGMFGWLLVFTVEDVGT